MPNPKTSSWTPENQKRFKSLAVKEVNSKISIPELKELERLTNKKRKALCETRSSEIRQRFPNLIESMFEMHRESLILDTIRGLKGKNDQFSIEEALKSNKRELFNATP